MAKIKIQGNASGTGTLTLTAPNTNADRTITLPDEDITLGGGVDGIVSTANATAITIDSSENVGIGVVPESWSATHTALDIGQTGAIAGHDSANRLYAMSNAYDNSSYKYKTTSQASSHEQSNGAHYFFVAPLGTADSAITWTTAMKIDNSGNWLHGTVLAGNPFFTVYNGASGSFCNTGTDSTVSRAHFYFTNPNGDVGSIRTTGSATSYNTSSDYRLKENVVPMTGSIDRLKALNPSRFNFIADTDTTVDGFLAHEAQEVVPEAITGTKDAMMTEEYEVTPAIEEVKDEEGNITTEAVEAVMGEREVPDMQGIDQSKLVPLLVASLQEAIARIETLETI